MNNAEDFSARIWSWEMEKYKLRTYNGNNSLIKLQQQSVQLVNSFMGRSTQIILL